MLLDLALFLIGLVLYEALRWQVLRALRERWQRSISQFLRRHGVELDQFRFIDRVWVRQALLQDPEIDRASAAYAAERGIPLLEARARIEVWLDEIVPYFNLFSYYKLGAAVARAATRFCYELVFDDAGLEAARKAIPPGAVIVYVANHRSNADYVVLSVGALRQVALSYAVGEWALVWPLDSLFRSFGSYFVRRGEKDPLYHQVLERYLQLVASRGLTSAFFLEGGLSRDGALRPPKIGLLDYLVGMLRSEPDRQIVFLPVGINYDRVLEDRNLLGASTPPGWLEKAKSFLGILIRAPRLLLAIPMRAALRSHRKFGYAAIAFGTPVRLSELVDDPGSVANLPRAERLPQMAGIAERLLHRVWRAIPATPVVLTCRAIHAGERELGDIRRHVREEIAELRAAGRPLGFGLAFASVEHGRAQLEDADSSVGDLDVELVAAEEAERAVDLALVLLRRRKLVRIEAARVVPADDAAEIIAYYARSLDAPASASPPAGA